MVLVSIPRSKSSLDTRPKYYLVEVPRRVAFTNMDSTEDDNPFRPGSELSREAEIIVNLIKEGKPITPTSDMTSANANLNNNNNSSTTTTSNNGSVEASQESVISVKQAQKQLQSSSPGKNGSPNDDTTVIDSNGGIQQVEVQHGIIIPSNDNSQTVEQVTLKKKRKCCSIQ